MGEVRGLCLEWIVLQPPLVDGGGRDWLLQEAGGLRALPAEEGFQHWGQLEGGVVKCCQTGQSQFIM